MYNAELMTRQELLFDFFLSPVLRAANALI